MDSPAVPPVLDLDPRPITLAQFEAFTPEKLELWDGYIAYDPDDPDEHDERPNLLQLLLTNVGLEAALRLAPEDAWRAAFARVFGRAQLEKSRDAAHRRIESMYSNRETAGDAPIAVMPKGMPNGVNGAERGRTQVHGKAQTRDGSGR